MDIPFADDLRSTGRLVKPVSATTLKRRKDRAEADWIQSIHEVVFAASFICAICGDTEAESYRKGYRHEMHEDPSRAKTRGWPTEDRFNTKVCMRVCSECHQGYTANQVRCVPLTGYGFAGSYQVQRNIGGKTWVTLFEVTR